MSRAKEYRGAAFGGASNGVPAFGGRPIGSVFFVPAHLLFYITNIYRYYLYIPLYISYLYVLNIFHICSFVCFVIYSANRNKSNFLIRGCKKTTRTKLYVYVFMFIFEMFLDFDLTF